jgi:hypothetical protein
MGREPSDATLPRRARSDLKQERACARGWQDASLRWEGRAKHYAMVLAAIGAGHYPEGLAALAAKHALAAMK